MKALYAVKVIKLLNMSTILRSMPSVDTKSLIFFLEVYVIKFVALVLITFVHSALCLKPLVKSVNVYLNIFMHFAILESLKKCIII